MWLEPCSEWDQEHRESVNDLWEAAQEPVVPPVAEGSPCPTCKRRVPYKKKPSSPQTKVISIRVPIGDADSFKEMLEAASSHLGLLEKPHSPYWTVLHGLVLVLQGPAGHETASKWRDELESASGEEG